MSVVFVNHFVCNSSNFQRSISFSAVSKRRFHGCVCPHAVRLRSAFIEIHLQNGDPNQQKYVLYRSQEKYSNIGDMHVCSQTCLPCDRVASSLACFLFVVCLFCCFCFVCVSHDEVSKPRSMQLIDLEVMSSTAEMSVLKCYHNCMQQRRGSIF